MAAMEGAGGGAGSGGGTDRADAAKGEDADEGDEGDEGGAKDSKDSKADNDDTDDTDDNDGNDGNDDTDGTGNTGDKVGEVDSQDDVSDEREAAGTGPAGTVPEGAAAATTRRQAPRSKATTRAREAEGSVLCAAPRREPSEADLPELATLAGRIVLVDVAGVGAALGLVRHVVKAQLGVHVEFEDGQLKRTVIFSGWGFFWISLGGQAPHVRPMWALNTRVGPNEIELTGPPLTDGFTGLFQARSW